MKWTTTVDDDGNLILPDELLQELGWVDGDMLEWVDREDGTFELKKVKENQDVI